MITFKAAWSSHLNVHYERTSPSEFLVGLVTPSRSMNSATVRPAGGGEPMVSPALAIAQARQSRAHPQYILYLSNYARPCLRSIIWIASCDGRPRFGSAHIWRLILGDFCAGRECAPPSMPSFASQHARRVCMAHGRNHIAHEGSNTVLIGARPGKL